MSKYPEIEITKTVTSLSLTDGQAVTLWLYDNVSGHNVQVEIRVTLEGKREVFCDHILSVKGFSDWYDMEATDDK